MKAMILEANQPIESDPLKLIELPAPTPGLGEIRIQVRACAICRTDLHVIEGDLPTAKLPIIPGHQIIGRVDQLGPGCEHLRIGDRVGAAWLHATCRHCEYCLSGKENLCSSSLYTGYSVHGGFAEYAIAKESFTYPIPMDLPMNLDDESACPLLCAGIIGYRALSRSHLPERGALGIFGFGSSAHIVIQIALFQGCRVYVMTRAPEHQALARQLGASWVSASASDLPDKLDSAILFAPAGDLVPIALQSLKKGGTLAVAGIHLSRIPELDYHRDLFFERDLRSVTANTRQDGRELFALAPKMGKALKLHTRAYSLFEANQALQDLKKDRIRGTGILSIGP